MTTQTGSIYALIDPRDTSVRYVGQTINDLKRRLWEHMNRPTNPRMRVWVDDLTSQGLQPEIKLLEKVAAVDLIARERYWLTEMFVRGERPFQNAPAEALWILYRKSAGAMGA